ncbi:MAG: hypothetical protein H6811_08700 [Phycisphaeraceae bacterium]|nr:hypothetical protein [Phycisphaeraceae bacterium]
MKRIALLVVGLSGLAVGGPPFDIPVDESQSSVTVTLTIPFGSDSDSSPVSGVVTVSLDDADAPSLIELHNFELLLTQSIDLDINAGILGRITATGTSMSVEYATPGETTGPAAIEGGAFLFENVPVLSKGVISYNATGAICALLQGAGLQCSGTFNLLDAGAQIVPEFGGTIGVAGGVVTLSNTFAFETPLDPLNPGLGSVSIDGSITGSAEAPVDCPADIDGDGDADGDDFFAYLDLFVAGDPGADLDGDGDRDADDFFLYLDSFAAGC